METKFSNKYQISVRIGGGSFGEIFLAKNKISGDDVAIKIEMITKAKSQLRREAKIYKLLAGEGCFMSISLFSFVTVLFSRHFSHQVVW
jgi:serine/threonine protein kinase